MNTNINPNDYEKLPCPACHGRKTQYNAVRGTREVCAECDGRGVIVRPKSRIEEIPWAEGYGPARWRQS